MRARFSRGSGGSAEEAAFGRLIYALVDFELLQRTEKYQGWSGGDLRAI